MPVSIPLHLITKLNFDYKIVARGLYVNEIININFWVIGNLVVILDMELIQHEWTYDDVASLLVTTVGQNTRNILQHNIWLVVKSFVCGTHEFQSLFRILNKKSNEIIKLLYMSIKRLISVFCTIILFERQKQRKQIFLGDKKSLK